MKPARIGFLPDSQEANEIKTAEAKTLIAKAIRQYYHYWPILCTR